MKIMVVGPMDSDSFADNVSHTLRAMGHEVLAPGPAQMRMAPRRAEAVAAIAAEHSIRLRTHRERHITAAAAKFRPELTITLDRRLGISAIRELHAVGSRVYLWFPDAVSNLGRHEVFLAGYDRIYLKNPVLAARLHDIQGLDARYMPEACNPDWHSSTAPYGQDPHLVMVGNVHPTRAILLSRLLEAGVPMRIYGAPPSPWVGHAELLDVHAGTDVRRQQKADVFRGAVGVLNNLHPAEFGGTNCRLFEATAAGAVVFTEQREGLAQLFDVGHEVLTFGAFDELVSLYERARVNSDWAAGVGEAAARRSLADHTYTARLAEMLRD